jgi:energy-coupling factor transporter ATP-binding protein EcfA2
LERLEPLAKPFIFVTGKGGSGKTTVSAALAAALSRLGRRVLLATSDPKERASRLLGVPRTTAQITLLSPNLWGVNIDPARALSEYGDLVLKVSALRRAVFDNRPVQRFFAAVPGLHQWAVLGKAWFHSTERIAHSPQPRFQHVILDGPATGHALEMLWIPKIISEVAHTGVLLRDAQRAWSMLHDPAHTSLVLVALSDEASSGEALDLNAKLQQQLALRFSAGVANAVLSPLLAEHECRGLAGLDLARVSAAHRDGVEVLLRRALREQDSRESLQRLHSQLPIPWFTLPRVEELNTPAALRGLAAELSGVATSE